MTLQFRILKSGHFKLATIMAGFVASWYLGQLIADFMMDDFHGPTMIQKMGQKQQIRAPPPKRHKCGQWASCPSGAFAFLVLSGSAKLSPPKICFEDEILLGRERANFDRGMNIAIVEVKTGKHIGSGSFDLWGGDNSGKMIEFIKKAPDGSLIFMTTFDDGSVRLTENAKKYIEKLGSKEIRKLAFRGNWVFIGTKGFTLPKGFQREKIINSEQGKNRYKSWPAEIQIDGCFSPKTDYLWETTLATWPAQSLVQVL